MKLIAPLDVTSCGDLFKTRESFPKAMLAVIRYHKRNSTHAHQGFFQKFSQEGVKPGFGEIWGGGGGGGKVESNNMAWHKGGSGGPPPENFWNLGPLRPFLAQSDSQN